MTFLLVALGAAIGAPLRYLTDQAVRNSLADRAGQARQAAVFPWGTLTVNVVGSFILGSLVALPANGPVTALFGTGFCGALTTYSTFSYETLRLAQGNQRFSALANVLVSVFAGLGAAACGLLLARALTGH